MLFFYKRRQCEDQKINTYFEIVSFCAILQLHIHRQTSKKMTLISSSQLNIINTLNNDTTLFFMLISNTILSNYIINNNNTNNSNKNSNQLNKQISTRTNKRIDQQHSRMHIHHRQSESQ